MSEHFYYLLSPQILDSKDKSYPAVEELDAVLDKEGCNNIALTGAFGSGKSSIIKTLQKFEKKEPEETKGKRIYLNISLATLDDEKNDIEYSIVQQLIYKADEGKIHQSRFSNIKHIDGETLSRYSIVGILLFFAYIIAFEPTWLRVDGIYNLYDEIFGFKVGYWFNVAFDTISVGFILSFIFSALKIGIKRIRNLTLSKIDAKNGMFEFSKSASFFNKHLDEIVYFFKATDYNIVVFEDLDRVSEPKKLFVKLREINVLLNDSEYFKTHNKTVKFIYAIKDDVFTGEERTKYFDYIISAIPLVNAISMSEYLVKEYGKTEINSSKFDGITNEHLSELGSFITGMRELRNVVNEFLQYNEQLGDKLEGHKLLAITIYKNNHPQDYAALHDKNGVLYGALQSKMSFADAANAESISELTKLEENHKSYRDELEKCRTKYIDKLKSGYDFEGVVVNEKKYTNEQIITSDRIFNLLANDRINRYIKTDGEDSWIEQYDKLFSNIAADVNPDFTYFEAVSEIEVNLKALSSEIDFLYREIDIKKRSSLSVIIKSIRNGNEALEIIKNACKDEKKQREGDANIVCTRMSEMILYLLKHGYIDELFSHYISFSHSDEKDDTFIKNIKLNIQNKYDYTLTDVSEVLKRLPIDYYDSNIVLNYDLLDGILLGEKENEAILDKVISVVKKGEIEFIVGYERIGKNAKRFFEILLSKWSEYLYVTFDQNSNEKHDELLIIFFKYCTTPNVFNDSRGKLSDSYKFIIDNLGKFQYALVDNIISKLKITFNNLIIRENEGAQKLFDYVINNGYYDINTHNLKTIIGDDFSSKSFTSILNFGNSNVSNYLKGDIELLGGLFAETSVEESKEAIIELLNNSKLPEEFKIGYIKKQLIIIDSLAGLSAENERILFITDHIEPTWDNVIKHFINSGNKLDENLRAYVERNVNNLKNVVSIKGETNKNIDDLFIALFSNNNLSFEVYRLLVPGFETKISNIDVSIESQRLRVLIKNSSIEYNEDTITAIHQNFSSDIIGDFLVTNFDEYIDDVQNEITFGNIIILHLLRSTLTMDSKIRLLNNKVSAIADDDNGADLAKEICYYYAEYGVKSDSNVELILIALSRNKDWLTKINVINSVNSSFGYQKERVVNMITSLADGYLKLNSFYGSAIFDLNDENRCLLDFLKNNRHFVKNVAEENGKLKVSFYHK